MTKYDSILKEKKEKTIPKEKIKKFPKFLISFTLIIIVLIISYVIYFNKILSPKNIIINDCMSILKNYTSIIQNLPIQEFKNENNITGNIEHNLDKYDFNLIKNTNNLSFNIYNNNNYINYYLLNNKAYIKVPSINEYIYLPSTISLNTLLSLEEKIKEIEDNKYLKSLYFNNKEPIVEINLSLATTDINKIFGTSLKDNYNIIATFKNNAIMNNIEEIKIIINNTTKSTRNTIFIKDNEITYKTPYDNYKIALETNNKDFIIKISKNDTLYSVLSGTSTINNYKYTYQIINKIYNINIISTKNNNIYNYEITKKKDEVEDTLNINLKVENTYLIEEDATNFIDADNGLIKDSYNNDINYFKDKFKNFLN